MAATSGWVADELPGSVGNDQKSNNRSGFTALPGGARVEDGIRQFRKNQKDLAEFGR
jgi:hypothetical protein